MSNAEDRSAPEGAECHEHPERRAFFTCPRCNRHVCIMCWQDAVDRCHACVRRDPTAGIDPLPWEMPHLGFVTRYLRTLGTAFAPRKSAAAFAYDDVPAAVRFLWLTALPLAMLAGIIPFTTTMMFGDGFGITLVGDPAPQPPEIALDIVRAMGFQVLLTALDLGCLVVPFYTLVRAYGRRELGHAALRVVFYRGWLLPAAALFYSIGVWALPAPPGGLDAENMPAGYALFLLARDLIPLFLLLAMMATARLACGLGPIISMVVMLIPAVLRWLAMPLITLGLARLLLPTLPALSQ